MSAPRLGAVFVHFHTPELLAEAIAALLHDWEGSGLAGEIVIVDNGSDAAGRTLLAGLPAILLEPGSNVGFAVGANLGATEVLSRNVDILLFVNPDAFVKPGCSCALAGEIARGAAAAGPLFFWDREERILLPPTERRTRTDELLSALSSRGEAWAARARQRWRRHARQHWLATSPFATAALSGGLLAVSRAAWETIGPFDAAYRLYFEETDWLLRLVQKGGISRLVPAARAIHLHGRSAVAEPAAAHWFEESAVRFRTRFYGGRFAALLARAAREVREALPSDSRFPHGASIEPFPDSGLDLARLAHDSGAEWPLWVELSPRGVGFPAAAERIEREPAKFLNAELGNTMFWNLPREIAERMEGTSLWVTVSDAQSRELGRWEVSL